MDERWWVPNAIYLPQIRAYIAPSSCLSQNTLRPQVESRECSRTSEPCVPIGRAAQPAVQLGTQAPAHQASHTDVLERLASDAAGEPLKHQRLPASSVSTGTLRVDGAGSANPTQATSPAAASGHEAQMQACDGEQNAGALAYHNACAACYLGSCTELGSGHRAPFETWKHAPLCERPPSAIKAPGLQSWHGPCQGCTVRGTSLCGGSHPKQEQS